jgi:hypothetical protein
MLESGEFATIAELAEREGIAPSYMTRVLRLTLLAPDIVEAILDGKQGPEVTLARVLEPFPDRRPAARADEGKEDLGLRPVLSVPAQRPGARLEPQARLPDLPRAGTEPAGSSRASG